ncbi:MAG: ATP-dependent helicase [Desulfitobacterium hafniense]|nr:ATP-dependent helicase [Desulfitobacterium hafniense]
MAIPVISITSEDKIEINSHFKISAGPGAGKTHWLINHIKHVIRESERLGNSRKIACITYTNVASETILERLGIQVEQVEVSTIHSFLYKNIVKPFAFLIPSDYELNILRMDGHDEVPVYKGMLYDWKRATNQTYLNDDKKIIEALSDLAWHLNEHDEIILRPRKPYAGRITKNYSIRSDSYLEYKKMNWRKGTLHHDDVLFFSYILIKNFSRLLDVLRARFPYFFVDEFQDTNPIQTYILKKISESETTIGIIGDIAQSIYVFQGARPEHFTDFSIPEMKQYTILDNHRSTNSIVSVLNLTRSDITQNANRNIDGEPPRILVGNYIWAYEKSCEITNGTVCSLSRDNITSNVMRYKVNGTISNTNLINDLREIDSNTSRANIIIACLKATEFARQLKYKEAFKELSKELRRSEEDLNIQVNGLNILKTLLSRYEEYKINSLLEYHTLITSIFPIRMAGFRAGIAKTFYEEHTYYSIALSVNIINDNSIHRTIHKAKGAEFDNVLLVLNKRDRNGIFLETEELGYLITPDLTHNEEHRIRYVAISRAKNLLFINVPCISSENEKILGSKDFQIIKQAD